MNKIFAILGTVILIYILEGKIQFSFIPEPVGIAFFVWIIISSILDEIGK